MPSLSAAAGADGYQVVRDGVQIADVKAPLVTYTDATAANGVQVCYQVRAYVGAVVSDLEPAVAICVTPAPAGNRFTRGDCNGDDIVDVSDTPFGLGYLFSGGNDPLCLEACDSNSDGAVDVSDPVNNLQYLFQGGNPFAMPFPACDTAPVAKCAVDTCNH